ncbi:transglycosylase domain-containing protein [Thalassobacillus devorans]|uniref:transglycosylase domain-containing protein n=1 Tax=Thalassobacillus devorans TaxID=279813 RepID=UPI0004BB2A25|nr:transglycosylase domain-containing protein [Thalassobacillus devorans]
MSNNPLKGINKAKIQEFWQSGKLQKSSRITYDVAWNIILFFIILGVIGLFFAGGAGAGYFASLVKDETVRSKKEMSHDIYDYSSTSELYFADNKYLGKIRTDLHREEVKLEEVSPYLKNAIIATEDANFKEHDGVVPKAIMRAVAQEVTNASVKTGGSTLTQQLIKNQILTNEVSFERKAKEILLALRLERFFEKDEILEAYLNIVPFGRDANGRNIAGIQTAAQGIFDVEAKDLSLPQAAFIAGLPQSPTYYSPFTNGGKVKESIEPGLSRMREVLSRMLEGGYITQEEYDKAINYDVKANLAKPETSSVNEYPWLTFEVEDRATDVLSRYLAKQAGYTMEDLKNDDELRKEFQQNAERELRSGGYKVHTTIDKAMYDVVQKVKNEYTNYGRDKTTQLEDADGNMVNVTLPVQVGSVIMENKTGKVLAFIGGRDFFNKGELNHATQARRSAGSTMKPILAYAPGIEEGVLHPGSVFADVPYRYESGKELGNYTGRYHGFTSVRYALAKSYNVPAVKAFTKARNKVDIAKYGKSLGFTTIPEEQYSYQTTAIGAPEVTIEENTNAFAALGNNGQFADAYMIEKIVDKNGETIYEHKSKAKKVFSPQTAYLTLDMMRDVLKYGTAAGIKGQLTNPGVDWAGKTGTSNSYKDTWFIATNPNITVSMWMGYDYKLQLDSNGYSSRNTTLWARVVNAISEVKPDVAVPNRSFQRPEGIVQRSYCATSGLLPSDLCSKAGLVESDIYNAKYAPSKRDDSLITGGNFVNVKGKTVVAGPNTPREFVNESSRGVMLNPDFLKENNLNSPEKLRHLIPSSGKWSNVALPSGTAANVSESINNDGQNPATPGGVSASGSAISWAASSSNDVVGYRVYRASSKGGPFSLIGSTTNTKYGFSGSDGFYAVRAVDYFGMESSLSSSIKVGSPGQPSEPEEPADTPPEKPKKEPEEEPEEQPEQPPADDTSEEPSNNDDSSSSDTGSISNGSGNNSGSENGNTNENTEEGNTDTTDTTDTTEPTN